MVINQTSIYGNSGGIVLIDSHNGSINHVKKFLADNLDRYPFLGDVVRHDSDVSLYVRMLKSSVDGTVLYPNVPMTALSEEFISDLMERANISQNPVAEVLMGKGSTEEDPGKVLEVIKSLKRPGRYWAVLNTDDPNAGPNITSIGWYAGADPEHHQDLALLLSQGMSAEGYGYQSIETKLYERESAKVNSAIAEHEGSTIVNQPSHVYVGTSHDPLPEMRYLIKSGANPKRIVTIEGNSWAQGVGTKKIEGASVALERIPRVHGSTEEFYEMRKMPQSIERLFGVLADEKVLMVVTGNTPFNDRPDLFFRRAAEFADYIVFTAYHSFRPHPSQNANDVISTDVLDARIASLPEYLRQHSGHQLLRMGIDTPSKFGIYVDFMKTYADPERPQFRDMARLAGMPSNYIEGKALDIMRKELRPEVRLDYPLRIDPFDLSKTIPMDSFSYSSRPSASISAWNGNVPPLRYEGPRGNQFLGYRSSRISRESMPVLLEQCGFEILNEGLVYDTSGKVSIVPAFNRRKYEERLRRVSDHASH